MLCRNFQLLIKYGSLRLKAHNLNSLGFRFAAPQAIQMPPRWGFSSKAVLRCGKGRDISNRLFIALTCPASFPRRSEATAGGTQRRLES